jgi:hypothetical protein
VGTAVLQVGAGDDLTLDQAGELGTERRGVAIAVVAVVVSRHPAGLRVGVPVAVQRDQQVGVRAVGEAGSLGIIGIAVGAASEKSEAAQGVEPTLDARRQVEHDLNLL